MRDTGSGSSGEIPRPFMPGEQEEPHDSSVPAEDSSGAYDSAVDAGGLVPPFVPGREPLYYASDSGEPPPEVIVDQVAGLASHAVELPPITDFLYEEPEPDAMAESGYGPLTGEHGAEELAGQTPAYGSPASTPAYGSPGMTPSHGGARQTPAYGGQWQTPAHTAVPLSPHGTGQATPAYGTGRQTPARSTPVPPLPGFTPSRGTPAVPMPSEDPRMTPARGSRTFEGPSAGRAPPPPPPPGLEPWATGEWQRYDWRAAAALGPEERARAAQAWADLDWEGDARNRATQRNDEIAAALEEIARRVRAGELHVHGHAGMTAEAAAAAALAALLAKRT